MMAFDMMISMTLAIAAAAVGLINTLIWIRLANKVTDSTVQAKFMYFALVTMLLSSGEIVFVIRKGMKLTGGMLEYIQYGFIVAGFLAFMLSARLHLRVSEMYGVFSRPASGRTKAKNTGKGKSKIKDKIRA